MSKAARMLVIALAGTCACGASFAGGPLLIDHRYRYDNSGIWKDSYQDAVVAGVLGAAVGGALWEGGDNRLGRTLWQSMDAMAFSTVTTEVAKYAFSRERPRDSADSGAFFKGHGNDSFPSLHVAAMSAVVTPVVLEYGREYPEVYGLEALIAYEIIGRVKTQDHWQSDVLVGWLIGAGYGWYAHGREQPLILEALPNGFYVGFKKAF